jgi:hypothetical protein
LERIKGGMKLESGSFGDQDSLAQADRIDSWKLTVLIQWGILQIRVLLMRGDDER